MTHYAMIYGSDRTNYTMIENYTFLRNESQPLKFLYFRQLVVSAKCLFGEKSVRQTVRSKKCSFDKVSVGKMPVRQNVFRQNDFRQSVFRQNVRVPKSIVCHTAPVRLTYHRREGGDLDQAFSQKGVRASLDGFGPNIGRLRTPKILKGKKITSVFNEEALTKASSTFLTFIAQLTI